MTELITVKQLPILEEQFKEKGKEIDEKVQLCRDMVVTEDNFRDIKKIRAELNKDSKMYAVAFKEVKDKVLAPWNAVDTSYKENIKEKYATADAELKCKISEVETGLKAEKESEVKHYYEEYAESCDVDFAPWERTGIKVGMSDSMKSLKAAAKDFIDKIVADMALIDTQEYKAEILAEYKIFLDASKAITTVSDRLARVAAEKKRAEQIAAAKAEEAERVKEVEQHISAPVKEKAEPEVQQQPEQFIAFKVYGNKAQFMKVVEFLNSQGLKYEQINM